MRKIHAGGGAVCRGSRYAILLVMNVFRMRQIHDGGGAVCRGSRSAIFLVMNCLI
mgnify:CR=1 FL=1